MPFLRANYKNLHCLIDVIATWPVNLKLVWNASVSWRKVGGKKKKKVSHQLKYNSRKGKENEEEWIFATIFIKIKSYMKKMKCRSQQAKLIYNCETRIYECHTTRSRHLHENMNRSRLLLMIDVSFCFKFFFFF